MEETQFNFDLFEREAIAGLRSGKKLEGKDGVLAPLLKRLLEASLQGELTDHLANDALPNRRNGKMSKEVKTSFGKLVIETPRDRNSTFEPQVLPKRKTVLGEALDHKVLSLYSYGMSYNDICKHLDELYGLTVAPSTLTAITDSVIEDVKLVKKEQVW